MSEIPTESENSPAGPIDVDQIPALVQGLRAHFRAGHTRPVAWRRQQLQRLQDLVVDNEDKLLAALASDLGRSPFEGWLAEISYLTGEIHHTLKNLQRWMRPRRERAPLVLQPARSQVVFDPLGVVLIISPWNYPIQLCLAPLIGAIAAGNCAVLKPSEVAPASSAVLAALVPRYLDPAAITVVEGAVPETTALLAQRWDHIFFTGGEHVGRVVMRAAAEHLTPVTLELGGKSPCVVDATANLEVTAKRILWGKCFNAGQTCIAPDYILVEQSVHDALIEQLRQTIRGFFGADPSQSPDYGRIINARHFARLRALLDGATVAAGGDVDEAQRYIGPTVLTGVTADDPVMQAEIFGPLLPVLVVDDMSAAIDFIVDRPKPLALYLFTADEAVKARFLAETSAGGVSINDTVSHFVVPGLPFGGVGTSGMGAYHGHHSFETFSHKKGVLDKPTWVDPSLRYPPYDDNKKKLARRLMN